MSGGGRIIQSQSEAHRGQKFLMFYPQLHWNELTGVLEEQD